MKCKKLQKNNIWQCAKAERDQNEEQKHVFLFFLKKDFLYIVWDQKKIMPKFLKSTLDIHKTVQEQNWIKNT